ncbi:MAG: hypothetical protein QNK37_16560 [Acidobacteriota bacterium]|nr:hypothetical protein [Acidobacteriota bacterium]
MNMLTFFLVLFQVGPGLRVEASPPEPKPRWDLDFSVRGWHSSAGSGIGGPGTFEGGEAIAPSIGIDARRRRLQVRMTYQFDTLFQGYEQQFGQQYDRSVTRRDLDLALAWEFGTFRERAKNDFFLRALLGYKNLTITEDVLATTDINDDLRHDWRGPLLGLAGLWRRAYQPWDLKFVVAYADLNTRVQQKTGSRTTIYEPFSYPSQGLFLDLSLHYYLPGRFRKAQLVLGYRGQWYRPDDETTRVRNLFTGEDNNLLNDSFEASGPALGISFSF